MKENERVAAFWFAVGKIAQKEQRRAELVDGAEYSVGLDLRGKFPRGATLRERIAATINVGEAGVGPTSAAMKAEPLLAFILGELPKATRERLAKRLPDVFAKNKQSLPASAELLDLARSLLKRLRATGSAKKAGPVRVTYNRG